MNLAEGQVLKVLKPLSGIPDSGLHWFLTYQAYHKQKLQMKSTKTDPCVLYKRNHENLWGMTVLQVDDSFGFGDEDFLSLENYEAERFKSKPCKILEEEKYLEFNGISICRLQNRNLKIAQSKKLPSFILENSPEQFRSTRAWIQYVGCCTRPDLSASVQLLAKSSTTPEISDYKKLKKISERCKETSEHELNFIQIDMSTVRLALFTDASFANTDSHRSQLGFVLLMVDDNNDANIIHYGS